MFPVSIGTVRDRLLRRAIAIHNGDATVFVVNDRLARASTSPTTSKGRRFRLQLLFPRVGGLSRAFLVVGLSAIGTLICVARHVISVHRMLQIKRRLAPQDSVDGRGL